MNKSTGKVECKATDLVKVKPFVLAACPVNEFSVAGGSCTKCSAGKSTRGNTGQTRQGSCSACPANTFNVVAGGSCTKCSAGKSTLGHTGQTSCSACPTNTFNVVAGGPCTKCSAGKSTRGQTSSTRCSACPANTFNRVAGGSCQHDVATHCAAEKKKIVTLRTGLNLRIDEEVDDKTCHNKNRDVVVTAFCNFRRPFERMLKEGGSTWTGRQLWPNICCKEDNFENLRSCDDPAGKASRSEIVPFALAQGGNLTPQNLYGELVDVLRYDGYLHKGLVKALTLVDGGDALKNHTDTIFEETSLCGPRIFTSPVNSEVRVCELFMPYGHVLNSFRTAFQALAFKKGSNRRRRLLALPHTASQNLENHIARSVDQYVAASMSRAVEHMKIAEGKLSSSGTPQAALDGNSIVGPKGDSIAGERGAPFSPGKSIVGPAGKEGAPGKDGASNTLEVRGLRSELTALRQRVAKLLRKQGTSAANAPEEAVGYCLAVTVDSRGDIEKARKEFCRGYEFIDLANVEVLNYAFVHIDEKELSNEVVKKLMTSGRYEIEDKCPTKMFAAQDISIQRLGEDNMFVVQLDSTSPDGYLRKELPMCGKSTDKSLQPRIPRTKISVKVYDDEKKCCEGTKEYRVCKINGCSHVPAVKSSSGGRPFEYMYDVKGTTFEAIYGHKPSRRRRRLLGYYFCGRVLCYRRHTPC